MVVAVVLWVWASASGLCALLLIPRGSWSRVVVVWVRGCVGVGVGGAGAGT